jgi:hypothetical protein
LKPLCMRFGEDEAKPTGAEASGASPDPILISSARSGRASGETARVEAAADPGLGLWPGGDQKTGCRGAGA